MSSNHSYQAFAKYYDILTQNISYAKRAEYFNRIIVDFSGNTNGILLDLACGTGSLSEEFARLGYDVIGVDNSYEMLNVAMDKKFDSGLDVQYLCQDMTKLDMFGTVDITICALDSLNHLPNFNAVEQAAKRVSLFSSPGALFIFDVNTQYKHINVLADNTYVYDMEEVFCVWQNAFSPSDCSVEITLDFFEKSKEHYTRYSESFREVAYPIDKIDNMLKENGFEVLACYDYDTRDVPKPTSEKIVFVSRRCDLTRISIVATSE